LYKNYTISINLRLLWLPKIKLF